MIKISAQKNNGGRWWRNSCATLFACVAVHFLASMPLVVCADAPYICQGLSENLLAADEIPVAPDAWPVAENKAHRLQFAAPMAAPVQSWNCGYPIPSAVIATLDGTTLTVSGTGRMADYDSYTIPWLPGKTSVTKIIIGEGVTHLSSCATFGFKNLVSVTLPQSLKSLGQSAFYGSGLEEISLPANLSEIDYYVFGNCVNLKTVRCAMPQPLETPDLAAVAFSDTDLSKATLVVPASSALAYANAKIWNNFGSVEALETYLGVSADSILIGATDILCGFNIIADDNKLWTVTSNKGWIVPSVTSGRGGVRITFAVGINMGPERQATIAVASGSIVKTVTVRQALNAGASSVSVMGDSVAGIGVSQSEWNDLLSPDKFETVLNRLSISILKSFKDDFDYIFFVLDAPRSDAIDTSLGFHGVNLPIKNAVSGLGLPLFNDSTAWGSPGKLKSAVYFPYATAIVSGPALHELCHNWAAFICPTYYSDNTAAYAHWGVSNAGGQLGGFRYIRTVEKNSGGVIGKTKYQASFSSSETNSDGSFKNGGFGENANGGNGLPYSDLELYLMGMKSADELREKNFRLDVYTGISRDASSYSSGYFYATGIKSYTIDDIIAKNGERMPKSTGGSQKQFNVLTVVIGKPGSDTHYYEDVMRSIDWLAGSIDDTTRPTLYNFKQATYGAGSLTAGEIKKSIIFSTVIILSQPTDATMATGGSTTLVVSATGPAPLTYQWQVANSSGYPWANIPNAAPYSGATTNSLQISNAPASLSTNQYRCIVECNMGGNIKRSISSPISLTVTSRATITQQPKDKTIASGQNATFAISAVGAPAVGYQWQTSTNYGATWSNLNNSASYAGVTTPTLSVVAAAAALNGTKYRCVVTNTNGTATSSNATLYINTPPTFTAQPASRVVTITTQPVFTAPFTGKPTPACQWQLSTDGGVTWTDIYGETTDKLVLYSLEATMSGNKYRCVATNSIGKAISSVAILTIGVPPAIVTEPDDTSVIAGQNCSISIAATGTPAPDYQWQVCGGNNGGALWDDIPATSTYSGVNTSTLNIRNATAAMNNYYYRCVVTNTINSRLHTAISSDAALTVYFTPIITVQPISQTITAGQKTTFAISAKANPAAGYQWQLLSVGAWRSLTNNASYSGVTTAELTITSATADMTGNQYRCIVNNSIGPAVTSYTATLSVAAPPSEPVSIPATQTVTAGRNVTLAASAAGQPPPSYKWQIFRNGIWVNLANDATYDGVNTSVLVIKNATSAMTGNQYRYIANNDYGEAASNTLTLQVAPAIFPFPAAVTLDASKNLYVSDSGLHTIRKITPHLISLPLAGATSGTGMADGTGSNARFNEPHALAFDPSGALLVADSGNAAIRKINTTTGAVTTHFKNLGIKPTGIAVDKANNIHVADSGAHAVYTISATGITTHGDIGHPGAVAGAGAAARFDTPMRVATDDHNNLYIADTGNHLIRTLAADGTVLIYIGLPQYGGTADGDPATALLNKPSGMTSDSAGNIYFADTANSTIRMLTTDGEVITIAGAPGVAALLDGTGTRALFDHPIDVAFSNENGTAFLYIADTGNSAIRKLNLASKHVTTLAITAIEAPIIITHPQNLSATQGTGGPLTLTFSATGAGPLTSKWQKDDADITASSHYVIGANSLSINNHTPADSGQYRVIVSNEGGSVTSNPAVVTVISSATGGGGSGGGGGGTGGGGGGAPSPWYLAIVAGLAAMRVFAKRNCKNRAWRISNKI